MEPEGNTQYARYTSFLIPDFPVSPLFAAISWVQVIGENLCADARQHSAGRDFDIFSKVTAGIQPPKHPAGQSGESHAANGRQRQ